MIISVTESRGKFALLKCFLGVFFCFFKLKKSKVVLYPCLYALYHKVIQTSAKMIYFFDRFSVS